MIGAVLGALARPFRVGFPLLGKELVEEAARRRTYFCRVAYGLLLFGVALRYFYGSTYETELSPARAVLGSGRQLFEFVIECQFLGIYLVLPLLMAGLITREKERGSLPLLFLTHIKPTAILAQKFAGRLVPVVMFVFLPLPLLAVSYAHGGITVDRLAGGVTLLLLACLHHGAFCLLASSFCRSTVGALLASYLLYPVVGLVLELPLWVFFQLMLLGVFEQQDTVLWFPYSLFTASETLSYPRVLAMSLHFVAAAALYFVLARVFFLRRAWLPPRNHLLELFRRVDQSIHAFNDRYLRGLSVLPHRRLPGEKPIAWRETEKRPFAQRRYLVRIFLLLEIPVLLYSVPTLGRGGHAWEHLSFMGHLLWILGAVVVGTLATNAITSERKNDTLDTLLATPLTAREIIRQKMSGVLPLAGVFALVLITLYLLKAFQVSPHWPGRLAYVFIASLTVVSVFALLAWLAMWVGLRVRTGDRALGILGTILTVWILVPLVISFVFPASLEGGLFAPLALITPGWNVMLVDQPDLIAFGGDSRWALVVGAVGYGAGAAIFRWLCLSRGDVYLGRGTREVVMESEAKRDADEAE